MKRITHILMIVAFIVGLIMACCEGIVTVFGLGWPIQYLFNAAFIFVFVPVFSGHVVERWGKAYKEE